MNALKHLLFALLYIYSFSISFGQMSSKEFEDFLKNTYAKNKKQSYTEMTKMEAYEPIKSIKKVESNTWEIQGQIYGYDKVGNNKVELLPAIAIVKKYEDRFEFFGISQKIPSVLIDLIAEDKLMLRGEKMNLKNIKTSQLEFGKKIIGLP